MNSSDVGLSPGAGNGPTKSDVGGATACAYWIAGACLILLAAAGLRLHELSVNSLWLDEAIVANLSRGTFSDLLAEVRIRHSAPLLHPSVLWLVQKVESSAVSVRLVPVTASLLVVAGMLLLLPRLVGRWTTLQTALLYTFSTATIREARDAREYTIDALVAVLMIVGLMSLLRPGTSEAGEARGCTLLCVALFVAPLVQYGLVLFGCATLSVVLLARFVPLGGTGSAPLSSWNSTNRFHVNRLGWLFGSFAAGCCISYATTLRHQWQPGGYAADGYLAGGYFGGSYADLREVIEFVYLGSRHLVASYLPLPWAVLFVAGFGIALLRLRTRFDVIIVTAAIAFAMAVLAGLLRVYPYLGTRQAMYLVPILLLATTHATHVAVSKVSCMVGRPGVVHATMGLLAAVTVAAGGVAVADGKPYAEKQGMKSVLATLESRLQAGDAVFVARGAEPAVRFYLGMPPSNYYFSKQPWGRRNLVLTEDFLQYLVQTGLEPSSRLYIIGSHIALPDFRLLKLFYRDVEVERLVEANGETNLYVLEAPELMDRLAAPANFRVPSARPVIESTFDVYVTNKMLLFVRERCHLDDTLPSFFVHMFPANVDDLRARDRALGFVERRFHFIQTGMMMDRTCAALVTLPSYAIDYLRVGQGVRSPVWSGEAAIGRTKQMFDPAHSS